LGLGFGGGSAASAASQPGAPGTESSARNTGDGRSSKPSATTPYTPFDRFVPPDPLELARHFPQLEIMELLGQGGMGAVYKARQRRLDRLVALKILPPEVAAQPAFAERFTREARALGRLSHPHIVTMHDFGEAGGLYYFLMEFVDGVNLRQMIAGGKLQPHEALAIVPQLCEALQYAHDEGVVHRDIKPENLLLDTKGRVKIADFGLAKLTRPGETPERLPAFALTGSRQVMGTPHYMAPEQMERPQGVDHRADIYSMGVVFYEMLTGELPLGRFAPPSRKIRIDVRLDEVVMRSLEKEPERRYQHASEVKTDLDSISSTSPQFESAERLPEYGTDELLFKDARSQLSLPAVSLGIAGGVGFILSFIGLFIALSNVGFGHESHLLALVLAGLSLAISVLIAAGASAMATVRRYRLCRAASILAILPCHIAWLIGMPAGLSAWTVLSRPDVQAAFQGKKTQGRSRSRSRDVFVIAAGCLIVALVIGRHLWSSGGKAAWETPSTFEAPISIPTPFESQIKAPVLIQMPRPEGWMMGPKGPALTDLFGRIVLKLEPHQVAQVNKILQTVYVESLASEMESLTVEPPFDDPRNDPAGHVVITIKPYPGPIAKLENRLWSQLDEILNPDQQSIARLNLHLDPADLLGGVTMAELVRPGFFGWGKAGARIELWRVGSWYHWNVQTRGHQFASSARELPVDYRRFWKRLADPPPPTPEVPKPPKADE
jgi:serine/threonine protein kinase